MTAANRTSCAAAPAVQIKRNKEAEMSAGMPGLGTQYSAANSTQVERGGVMQTGANASQCVLHCSRTMAIPSCPQVLSAEHPRVPYAGIPGVLVNW